MNSTRLGDSIDHSGLEAVLGGTPTPLPSLSQDEEAILSASNAVVRFEEGGLQKRRDATWAFARDQSIQTLSVAGREGNRLSTVTDAAALLEAIEHALKFTPMPQKAYARAELDLGDAQTVRDQISGNDEATATDFLVSDGLTLVKAQAAFDAMRTSTTTGRIDFMTLRDGKFVLTYGIAIGQDGGDLWMITYAPFQANRLILETVLDGALHQRLENGWATLGLHHGQ